MPNIWNGFSTTPHTLPDACFCAGAKGGDFIELSCGHGGPGMDPIHVKCLITSFEPADEQQPQPPRCHICRASVEQETLAELTNYVRQRTVASFPDAADREQKESIYKNLKEALDLSATLAHAQRLAEGADAIQPTEDERQATYWMGEGDRIRELSENLHGETVGKNLTLEEIKQKQAELRELEGQIISLTNRAVFFENDSRVFSNEPSKVSLDDLHTRILPLLDSLTATDTFLRNEREMAERRDEGRTGHPQRIWNGFDTEPPTKPNTCAICFGEFGGEFMSLDCGHGARGNDPLHVRCLLDITSEAADQETMARCPICSASFDEDTLARLADCASRNREVRFPNDAGEPETARLFENADDQGQKQHDAIEKVRQTQELLSGEECMPRDMENFNDTSAPLVHEIETLAQEVIGALEDHAYTLEELEEKENTIDELEHRAATTAGHLVHIENWSGAPPFEERYQRLLEARERLEDAAQRMRQEKEDMQRREREGASHMQPA